VDVEARAPVDLKPIATVDVGSKVVGYLEKVAFERGDRVKRGELVATVRPSDLPEQLAAAKGNLAQAMASLDLARQQHERTKALATTGYAPAQEAERTDASVAMAKAVQGALEAQVRALSTRVGETKIFSPMDGVVVLRRLDPGAIVGLGTGGAILTLARDDVLRVFVAVGEAYAAHVQVGMKVEVTLDALPGRHFAGEVARIAPALDPGTRLLDVEVRLPNPAGALRMGMYGRARIILETHPAAVVVPASAVQVNDKQAHVFVLEGDKVARRTITLGVDAGDTVEIVAGLAAGEEVVIAGVDGLSHGQVVRVARGVDPFSGKQAGGDTAPRQEPTRAGAGAGTR